MYLPDLTDLLECIHLTAPSHLRASSTTTISPTSSSSSSSSSASSSASANRRPHHRYRVWFTPLQ
jgi:hypothetical protein